MGGIFQTVRNWGKNVWNSVKQTVAETCELIGSGVRMVGEKIKELGEWIKPKPVLPDIYVPTQKEEKIIADSGKFLQEKFPNGIEYAAKNASIEDRKRSINEIIRGGCEIFGIDYNQLDVNIESLDGKTCGAYNWRNRKLTINENMIVSNDPTLFEEQIYTVFHELTHAAQFEALSAYANDRPFEQYGYTEEQLYLFAQNWPDVGVYITAPYEDYIKQPVEAYAFGRENRIKLNYNNLINA